jgi:hypothetical protein
MLESPLAAINPNDAAFMVHQEHSVEMHDIVPDQLSFVTK